MDRNESILRSVALKAAVELMKTLSPIKEVNTEYITKIAEEFLEWLNKESSD